MQAGNRDAKGRFGGAGGRTVLDPADIERAASDAGAGDGGGSGSGSGSGSGDGSGSGGGGSGEPRRRGGWPRGRKRGPRAGTVASAKPAKNTLDINAVERILVSIHFGIAIGLQTPELQISDDEAKQYAEAIKAVARHYDIGASAKVLDHINLLTTMGSIYGIRAAAIMVRHKAEQQGQSPAGTNGAASPASGNVDLSSMTGQAASAAIN